MSNFTFLKTNWPDLYETARESEQHVNSAPRTGFGSAQPPTNARQSLETAVNWLYANDSYLKQSYADNLAALIHKLRLLRLRSAPVRSAVVPRIFCPTLANNFALRWYNNFAPHISLFC